jgi:carboxypeptidase C (cathepsin A)
LEEFVEESRNFADTEYLLALYRGDSLTGDARKTFVRKLSYYAGVSEEFLEEHGLRMDEWSWRSEFARVHNCMVSRHDARITLENVYPQTSTGNRWHLDDGVMAKYDPIFDAVLQGVLFPTLGIKNFNRTFVDSYVEKWKSLDAKKFNTGEQLCEAMRRNTGMRTFFANGWYDLCTQIGIVYYTINHAGLPKDRTWLKGYPSGHMLYIGEDNVRALTDDIRTFVLGGNPIQKK